MPESEEARISFVGEDKLSDLISDYSSQFKEMGDKMADLQSIAAKTADALGAGMKDVARNTEAAGQGAEKSVGLFQNLGGTLADVAKGAVSVAAGMMGLQAATSVLGALTAGFSEFVEGEVAMTRLGAAVKASGADWDALKAKTAGVADSYMKLGIADESVMAGLQRLTEITGNYQQSLSLLPVAADMAAAKGMDLATAAQLVGRAAQGSTTMLARYGIVLREGASATEAIAAIQQKFAGQAEAMAGTVQGQMTRVQMAFREVGAAAIEAFGPALIAGMTALANGLTALIPIAQQVGQAIVSMTSAVASGGKADGIAAGVTGMTGYVTAAVEISRASQQAAIDMEQMGRAAAVAAGSYNAAQAGMKQLASRIGTSAAAEAKFGAAVLGGGAAKPTIAAPKIDYSALIKQTAEAMASMQSTWTSGMAAINAASQSGYLALAQIANTFRIESARAEAEYQNQRAALIAEGNTKGLAELDAGYGKAKAMRELDKQIAIIQARAKAEGEIEEARRGFAQKMGLWLQEQIQKQTISAAGAAAIIQGIKTATGIEVSTVRTSTNELLALAAMKAAGVVGAQKMIDEALKSTIKLTEEETAAAAAAVAAREAGTATAIEKAIRDAYAAMGQFDVGPAGGGGAAEAVKKRAEEVVADIADTVESMVKSILEIKTTLQQKLPDIPGDVIGKWLDDLLSMTQQVADWAGPKGKGEAFGILIKWFNSDLLPDLKLWGEIIGSMNTLFSGIKSIHDTGSEKLAVMRTSVAQFFDALGGLFADVNTYMGRQGGTTGLIAITEPFQALDEQIVEWITSLQAGAEALGETLTSARAVIDTLVDKLPSTDEMGTSIGEIFARLRALFLEMQLYTEGMSPGGATPGMFAGLSEEIITWLTSLQKSLEPLGAVLESARGIFDSLVEPLKAMGTSVGAMFEALRGIMGEVQAYVGSAEGAAFADVAVAFESDVGIGATLTRWTKSLEPIKNILEMAMNIMALLVPELEDTKTSVDVLFKALLELVKDVQAGVQGEVGQQIKGMLDTWMGPLGVGAQLKVWAEALAPLLAILQTIKGILDIAATKVSAVKLSVTAVFDNLRAMLEQVKTQVEERSKDPAFQGAIDAFKEGGSLTGKLKELGEAMGNIKKFLDPLMQISDDMGKRLPIFRLNLQDFFSLLQQAFNQINTWFATPANQQWITDAVAAFDTITTVWLNQLETAMDTMSDNIVSLIASSTTLGPDVDALQNNVGIFLDSLILMRDRLTEKLDAFGDPVAFITRLSAVIASVLQIVATGFTPAEGEEAEPGLESGILMELLNTVVSLVQQILDQFQTLYAGIMSVRGLIGSISLAGAAQRMADSFVNKIQALIDASYFYDIGYDAGVSFKQGFNDAVGIASPSKVMIAAAKNIVNSFVIQAKSDADKMYQAGKSLGEAMEEGVRDALGMHSLSDVGIAMGQNLANSVATGMGGLENYMEPPVSGLRNRMEPTAAQRYMHQPGVDTAQAQWEREKLTSLTTNITFAGAVSIRSDKDIEEIANQVSRKLASRFSSMNRWGAKV